METTDSQTSSVVESIEKSNFAKDQWVKAYAEGNALWPQRHYPLIFPLASAIVNDPEADLETALSCKLSPDQIQRLGMIMTGQHRVMGVKVEYEHLPQKHQITDSSVMKINEAPLQELWGDFTADIGRYVETYIKASIGELYPSNDFSQFTILTKLQKGDNPVIALQDYELNDIAEQEKFRFFADKTSPIFQRFQDISNSIVTILKSPEGLALSQAYKASYNRRDLTKTDEEKATNREDSKRKVANLIKSNIDAEYKDRFPNVNYFTNELHKSVSFF